jgi:two-component system sensor histidine kinase CreC
VWWLNRAIGKLVHYADAVSQGQPASLPRLYSPELDRLGHSLETMRANWTARPISKPMCTA